MKQETEVFADGSNYRTTGLVPEDEQAELTFTNGTFFITRLSWSPDHRRCLTAAAQSRPKGAAMFTKQRGFAFWIRAAAIVIAVLIFLFGTFVGLIALPAGLRTPVIGLIGIVLVPVITFLTTRTQERHRARDDAIREKRTEFYGKAVRGMIGSFNIDKTAKKTSPAEQAKFFATITPEFILYASRGVIRAWDHFREVGQAGTADQMVLLVAFEDVFREMRKDLGHAVPRKPNLELMALFVNDLDSLKPPKKNRREPSAQQVTSDEAE